MFDHAEIFRNELDEECKFLNNKGIQDCVCTKDKDNNITKIFASNDVFQWESTVYLSFLEHDIFPGVSPKKKKLTYKTKEMVSLRSYFNLNKKCNKRLILSELFSYVQRFRTYRFMHGNLHIDNIFVNPSSFSTVCHFFVIDYANSYVLKKRHSYPSYKRSSFMREFETKNACGVSDVWDFFTVYVSLKDYFICEIDTLSFLDKIITTYISSERMSMLLRMSKIAP